MRNWKTTFIARYQVRTAKDRAVDLNCYSKMIAGLVQEKGKSRYIWEWIGGRYVCLG